jgi:hypothetical protein
MKKEAKGDLFDDRGDPFDDPLWKEAEWRAREGVFKTRPGWVAVPFSWIEQVLSVVKSPEQLVVAVVIYSYLRTDRAVPISNRVFADLGIGWRAKRRTLALLKEAGLISVRYPPGCSPAVRRC